MRLAPQDDVAVATRRLAKGTACRIDGIDLTLGDELPMGHKVALRPIAAGTKVRKFGVAIGTATQAIEPGRLVHVHNLASDYLINDVDHAEA
ncbi:MAG: UxaA family hydrolase [Geminicoccaceae bacterium]